MNIKAIDTEYDGYLFRSRLEARWAIFLDAMNIPWFYEHEGYYTDHGPYLPDFWLPTWRAFLEIKPGPPTEIERLKGASLANHFGHSFIVASSTPASHSLTVYCQDERDGSGGVNWWEGLRFATSNVDGGLCIDSRDNSGDRTFMLLDWDPCHFMQFPKFLHHGEKLDRAIHIAMTARFEHGKTPTKQQVQFG